MICGVALVSWLAVGGRREIEYSLSLVSIGECEVVRTDDQLIFFGSSALVVLPDSEREPIKPNVEDRDLASVGGQPDVGLGERTERVEIMSSDFDAEQVSLIGNHAFFAISSL